MIGPLVAAVIGGLIGSVGVVAGVLIGQSMQTRQQLKARTISLARDIGVLATALLNQVWPGQPALPWKTPEYYRLSQAMADLTDCCAQLEESGSRRARPTYRLALQKLDVLEARWGAAHVKVGRGDGLTLQEINALANSFGEATRFLRPAAVGSFDAFVSQLRARVTFLVDNGIDADLPADS